jgi:glycine hydroxymethyltransferase
VTVDEVGDANETEAAQAAESLGVGGLVSLVARYHRDSTRRLHLVPSENSMRLAARVPYLTDALFRYCFATEGENAAWPGNTMLAEIEAAACASLRAVYGAEFVNIKPISGLNCMAVALSALTAPGSAVFSISQEDGGHAATQFMAERLGLRHLALPYDRVRYRVDADRLADLCYRMPGSKLIYLDQFMCLFPHDLAALRAAAGPDTTIHYDGSHVMGLIAGGQFQDPLVEGADSLGGSTHKSFPGPHKGVLLTNSNTIAKSLDEHAGHWVSHHHPADVAALAIAAAQMARAARSYAARTVANARHLGQRLAERGFKVCAADQGFTRSHQLWIDLNGAMPPDQASYALLAAGIVVNAIDIPYLPGGLGLRLGVQEASWLGMGTEDMDEVAAVFDRVLLRREDSARVRPQVDILLHRYAQPEEEQAVERLLRAVEQAANGYLVPAPRRGRRQP